MLLLDKLVLENCHLLLLGLLRLLLHLGRLLSLLLELKLLLIELLLLVLQLKSLNLVQSLRSQLASHKVWIGEHMLEQRLIIHLLEGNHRVLLLGLLDLLWLLLLLGLLVELRLLTLDLTGSRLLLAELVERGCHTSHYLLSLALYIRLLGLLGLRLLLGRL